MAPQELSSAAIAGIVALKAVGYLIFRGSNSQKDQFRRDPEHPSVRRLKSLQTARGRRLLTSGWWGVARHVNYFGDWIMGCAVPRPRTPSALSWPSARSVYCCTLC